MKRIFLIAVISIALLLPFSANAGHYIGAGFGRSSAEIPDIDFSESDFGYKIYGGYRFQKYFAAELFYLRTHEIGSAENLYWRSVEASGFGVGVLAAYPLTETFEIFGKLGLLVWNTDISYNLGPIISTSDDGTDPGFGIGLLSRINDRFTLRVEMETYDVQFADLQFGPLDGKVRLFSFGTMYRF